jgi:hypothetical protein
MGALIGGTERVAEKCSRRVGEQQPSGWFQCADVKGADFGRPTYIERDNQPVAGDGRPHDAGALGERFRDLGGREGASLLVEKAIADGDQHGRNA